MPVRFLDKQSEPQKGKVRFLDETFQDNTSAPRAALASFSDMFGFGLPKYGAALLQTLDDQNSSVIPDPTPFKERYLENLNDLRQKIAADYAANPLSTMAGGAAGFLSPGSLGSALTGQVERGVANALPQANAVTSYITKRLVAPAASNIALGQATSNLPLTDYQARGKEALMQGGFGAAIGGTLGPALDMLQSPRQNINPQAVQAEQSLQRNFPNLPKQVLSPAEMTDSALVDYGEGFFAQNPITSSSMAKFAKRTKEILEKGGSEVEKSTGLSGKTTDLLDDDQVHLAIANRVAKTEKDFKTRAEELYSKADALANNQKFVPENLIKATQTLRGEFAQGAYPGMSKGVVSNIGQSLEKNIPRQTPIKLFDSSGNEIKFQNPLEEGADTFAGLSQKREDINSLLNKTKYETAGSDSVTIRRLTMLKNAIDNDLNVLASNASPIKNQAAVKALRDANQFYSNEVGKFTTDISRDVQNILGGKGDFTKLYSTIIKQGRSNQIDSLKRLLGEDFSLVQQRVAQGLVRDADGNFDVLSNDFNKRINKIGRANLKAILGDQQAEALLALQRVGNAATRSKNFISGGSKFNLSSLGAGGAALGGYAIGAAGKGLPGLGAAIGLNVALGKIWYSPVGRKLLIDGLGKLPPAVSTEKITELVSRILTQISVGENQNGNDL